MKKVSIVGAGNVGATLAGFLVQKNLADIVLLDIAGGIPQGKALDIKESNSIFSFDKNILGTNRYEDTKNSDVIVVTAGLPRKPGMSRDDLLAKNTAIVSSVVKEAIKFSPGAILIIVSNPLDAMVYVASKVSNFPKNRILGMAGVLDSARFKTFIAEELKISANKVETMVLGSHGDDMVAILSQTKVDGKPLKDLISEEKILKLVHRTQKGGEEIVNFLKTGSAFFAPASSIMEMVEAIILDQKKVLPVTAYVDGRYGISDLFIGVPAKLGKDGIEEVIEIDLSGEEKENFSKSANHIKELISQISLS